MVLYHESFRSKLKKKAAVYEREIEDFKRDGFCVFPQYFTPSRLAEVEANLQRDIREVVPVLDTPGTMYEDVSEPNSLFRIEKMEQHDAFFRDLESDPTLAELAAKLLDDVAVPHGTQMFAKAPRIGAGTPPHQDGYYFKLEPNNALTFWIAIDRADDENGCVRYVAGSHQAGLRPHAKSQSFGFSLGITDFGAADGDRERAVIIEPGDMIAHHCLTIHRTDDNTTQRLRRALGIVYFGASSTVNAEAVRQHAREVKAEWKSTGRL